MRHVIHMRDIKPGMRSGKRHIPDIFIIHDETAILKSLSRTGIEGDHFRLVFLNGCSNFLIPDGIAGQIECFSSLASRGRPGVSAGDICAMEGRDLTNGGISYLNSFLRKDGDILKSGSF